MRSSMGMARQQHKSGVVVLSIVIVNSDGADFTLQCLESIFRFPPDVLFEVIVVDNCSRDSCLPEVHSRYPIVRTFSAPKRQGFAKNYNLGIRHSRGDYILILNNDTVVHPDAFNYLIRAAYKHPSYGMIGAKLLSVDGRSQTVCARSFPYPYMYAWMNLCFDQAFLPGKLWDRYLRWKLDRRPSGQVPCISGACMMIPRLVLDKIGLLDEAYDFYCEDIEWCHRVQAYGMDVAYIAEAEITHFGDQSLSKVKVWAKQSEYRSVLRYFRQYHDLSAWQAWVLWLATMLGFFLRGVVFLIKELLDSNVGYARAYFYLWSWVLHQHPASDEIAAFPRIEPSAEQPIGRNL